MNRIPFVVQWLGYLSRTAMRLSKVAKHGAFRVLLQLPPSTSISHRVPKVEPDVKVEVKLEYPVRHVD
jgi:hypothetical protein